MAMRSSGIGDICNVLKVRAVTVIFVLRLWFKTHSEPSFQGTYENVILDEFWSWVGKRKAGKRWVWYAYCADTGKILAFRLAKAMTLAVKIIQKNGTFDYKSLLY